MTQVFCILLNYNIHEVPLKLLRRNIIEILLILAHPSIIFYFCLKLGSQINGELSDLVSTPFNAVAQAVDGTRNAFVNGATQAMNFIAPQDAEGNVDKQDGLHVETQGEATEVLNTPEESVKSQNEPDLETQEKSVPLSEQVEPKPESDLETPITSEAAGIKEPAASVDTEA